VHLRQWPIDRLRRKYPKYRHKPLVLVETSGTRQAVAFVSKEANAFGIQPGMALVQARALCAILHDAPHDPKRGAESLDAMACWLMQFSPVVSVEPPDALFLDVTGSDRLFGGWTRLVVMIAEAMKSKSIMATTAMAPTPGAAWALAFSGCDRFVAETQPLEGILSRLPVESLRIDPLVTMRLQELGIENCGQLFRLPRQTLPCRFGNALLKRVDQALGALPEVLLPVRLFTPVAASMEFEAEIESLEIIRLALKRLMENRIVPELTKRGCGAKSIEIAFLASRSPAVIKTLQLSRPSRDPKNLFHLIELASESACCDDGFSGVRIVAKGLERLSDEQIQLLEQEEYIAERELGSLIERLRIMAGESILARPRLIESHIPEHAYELVRPESDPSKTVVAVRGRPPRLLRPPTEIGVMVAPTTEGPPLTFNLGGHVHSVLYTIGPERISGRWWSGHHKTRDYFEIEDDAGQRFWVFRVVETGKWYLHGLFD
jgi:protein ImuB